MNLGFAALSVYVVVFTMLNGLHNRVWKPGVDASLAAEGERRKELLDGRLLALSRSSLRIGIVIFVNLVFAAPLFVAAKAAIMSIDVQSNIDLARVFTVTLAAAVVFVEIDYLATLRTIAKRRAEVKTTIARLFPAKA